MKGFTFIFSLYISSLLICNARPLSRQASDTGSHSAGRDLPRSLTTDQLQVPLKNNLEFRGPTVDIQVGEGSYTVALDTKFAITWVGANPSNPYLPSNSSISTGQSFKIDYNSGGGSGNEFVDVMEITGIPQNFTQSIGSANKTFKFDGIDGVMGVGLPTSAQDLGIFSPNVTVLENMVKNNITQRNIAGIFVAPLAANISGSLGFDGATPDEILTSAVQFVPNTKATFFDEFWTLDVSITYGDGNQSVPILDGQCSLDSVSEFISLPIPSFNIYTNLTGAVFDADSGFMRVDDPTKLQTMTIQIGNQSYDFIADAQKWPQKFNNEIDGAANETFLVIANFTTTSVDNLCELGWPFFQRYYVALDGDKSEIGLAKTKFTEGILNG